MAGRSLVLDTDACICCLRCIEVCPHAVFEQDGKKVRIESRQYCMECGACARNCPVSAIQVESGVGCAAAIINGILKGKAPSCDCGGDKGNCC